MCSSKYSRGHFPNQSSMTTKDLRSHIGEKLIHLILEDSFPLATATIIDIIYMGVIPKSSISLLTNIGGKLKRSMERADKFTKGGVELIAMVFNCTTIVIQQI